MIRLRLCSAALTALFHYGISQVFSLTSVHTMYTGRRLDDGSWYLNGFTQVDVLFISVLNEVFKIVSRIPMTETPSCEAWSTIQLEAAKIIYVSEALTPDSSNEANLASIFRLPAELQKVLMRKTILVEWRMAPLSGCSRRFHLCAYGLIYWPLLGRDGVRQAGRQSSYR